MADQLVTAFICKLPSPNHPDELTKILKGLEGPVQEIDQAMLLEIAREKNNGKLAKSKTEAAIKRNSDHSIKVITRLSFSETCEETKIRLLCAFEGVRVPTASCILAWREPSLYPVIDRRACEAINRLTGVILNAQSVVDWLRYLQLVRDWATTSGLTPMEIDRRLYGWSRAKFTPLFPK